MAMRSAPLSTCPRTAARADVKSSTTVAPVQALPGPSMALRKSRTVVTPFSRNCASIDGWRRTWASISPGTTVRPAASIERRAGTPSAAAVSSIRAMRPEAMRSVADEVTRPSPCTIRACRTARSKVPGIGATKTIKQAMPRMAFAMTVREPSASSSPAARAALAGPCPSLVADTPEPVSGTGADGITQIRFVTDRRGSTRKFLFLCSVGPDLLFRSCIRVVRVIRDQFPIRDCPLIGDGVSVNATLIG